MGVSASSISRVTGVEVSYKNFNKGKAALLPQRLAIVGCGNSDKTFSTNKVEVTSAAEVAEKFGWGSPLHLAARQLFPQSGTQASFPVTIYPIADAVAGVAASGKFGATGTATAAGSGKVWVGGIEAQFTVASGATAANVLSSIKTAIQGVLEMPVTCGTTTSSELPLTAKFKGTIGNQISLGFECDAPGITISTTAMANGAADGDLSGLAAQMGNVWETMILDCFPYNNTTHLDAFYDLGVARWGVLNKKPVLVAHGCADSYATRSAVTDARPNDYINFLIQSTGSRELPCVIAAKGLVSDIMTTADKNPACGYKGLLSSLHTGDDAVQEDYNTRNLSIGKGASTNVKEGNVARLNDIVTFYHPASEGKYPSRRYVVDLVKLQNIDYNVRLIVESDEFVGVPLIPDEDVATNPSAVQPKTVKAALINLARSLSLNALISDYTFTKENLEVEIDSENPKRLNVKFPVKLSGNIEVLSADIYFGFYLGGE